MSTETAERTISVISEFREIPKEQITLDTTLEELDMDSLDGLNLIFELEEEFDITIPDEKALKMKTIGEMVAGIDLIRSGESLDEVTEEDFEKFRDSVKSKKTKTAENAKVEENAESQENAETGEVIAEGK